MAIISIKNRINNITTEYESLNNPAGLTGFNSLINLKVPVII